MATIALVDDDENIITSVSIFLEGEGYHVRTYNDGASALTALAEDPPDLGIFDIKMPRMDGLELLRRLRQSSNLPVIFLTSKDDEFDEALGLNLGADDYITKPFSQRLLGERVKAVLRRARAGLQPSQFKAIFYEDLHADQRGTLAEIEQFLGIAPFQYPQSLLERRFTESVKRPMPAFFAGLVAADVARITSEVEAEGYRIPDSWRT